MPASSSVSTSCQRFALREPGALVCASSSTSAICGRAREHGVEVQLARASTPRCCDDARAARSRGRSIMAAVAARPWVSTTATTTSRPSAREPRALLEHRVGLADAGRGAEQHPQPARAAHRASVSPPARRARGSARSTFTRRLAEEAEVAAPGRAARRARAPSLASRPRASATRSTCSRAYAGLMCGSRPEPEAVTASAGIVAGADALELGDRGLAAPRSPRCRSAFSGPRLLPLEAPPS